MRKINRSKSANRRVTVKLHGWPAEDRMITCVEACWMVDLVFETTGKHISHTVFSSDNYDLSHKKYEAFLVLVTD